MNKLLSPAKGEPEQIKYQQTSHLFADRSTASLSSAEGKRGSDALSKPCSKPLVSSPALHHCAPGPTPQNEPPKRNCCLLQSGPSGTSACSSYTSFLARGNTPQKEAVWEEWGLISFKSVWIRYKWKVVFKLMQSLSLHKSTSLPILRCHFVCSVPQCNLILVDGEIRQYSVFKGLHAYIQIYMCAFYS